ncbi:uncharacterized protein F4822DRAFT_196666 [Hypoxylon trugodes]|uniref:uncharacterized protein n=1 Tax=Hypoxylon trugodes TaxID=326681 RepID=UPI0021976868|nr:uncharacterized protein F4822DRAFT_196666 [Hypoxylon trugodes]KAI1389316.1 hypothetical protein F4822DRAFT_196666 [Hypoxylon trugodes]
MTHNHNDPDFRSIVNAAAEKWYSQLSLSPDHPQSNREYPEDPERYQTAKNGELATFSSVNHDGLTAWQSTLQALPEESRGTPFPVHPLAQALVEQPVLRSVEWNSYRQQGGFKPRTAIDYSSFMIYVSGQVNPNPCRNCRLKNGPYARCIVAPPSVLALSSLKHACANCTYQNQHRKCTNLPIDGEELVTRSRMARSSLKLKSSTPMKPPGRRPNPVVNSDVNTMTKHKLDHGHMIRKPTAQSISAEAFADKIRLVRSWSPRSRRRIKAEVMQWQAAVMTVEAENTRGSSRDESFEGQEATESTGMLSGPPPPADSHASSIGIYDVCCSPLSRQVLD